jgi:hypothetical protein
MNYTSAIQPIFLEAILTTVIHHFSQRLWLKIPAKSQNPRVTGCPLKKKNVLVFFVFCFSRNIVMGSYCFFSRQFPHYPVVWFEDLFRVVERFL